MDTTPTQPVDTFQDNATAKHYSGLLKILIGIESTICIGLLFIILGVVPTLATKRYVSEHAPWTEDKQNVYTILTNHAEDAQHLQAAVEKLTEAVIELRIELARQRERAKKL